MLILPFFVLMALFVTTRIPGAIAAGVLHTFAPPTPWIAHCRNVIVHNDRDGGVKRATA